MRPAVTANAEQEYDASFAADYDRLIDWDRRAKNEGWFFKRLMKELGATRVLDVACGTGFHVGLLRGFGLDVAGTDASPAMIAKARENLRARGIDATLGVNNWLDPDPFPGAPYDVVLCVGDSFAHLPDRDARMAAARKFHAALKDGGALVMDHRNYAGTASKGWGKQTGTDYCCCGSDSDITLEKDGETVVNRYTIAGSEHALVTYPFTSSELEQELAVAGFEMVAEYGDYALDFDRDAVAFMIDVARARR